MQSVDEPRSIDRVRQAPARFFWPVDWCHCAYLVGTVVLLVVFRNEAPSAGLWLALTLAFLIALFALARVSRGWPFRRASLARLLYVALVIPFIFTELGSLVPYVNQNGWEHRLFDFDLWLFGGRNPLEDLERMSHPLLTEVLQWVYDFYYFIPVILGVAVLKGGRTIDFARMTFCVVVCVYLSYVGYYVVPATGPNIDRFGLYDFETNLPGVFLATELRESLALVEQIKQDCFPSGHTAVSLLALMLAWRFSRRAVPVILPLAVALIFSTVYLRYHYVADVLAGVVLALFSFYGGLAIHARFERGLVESDGHTR